jgi:SAM-dependent methyltransferase
LQFAVGATRVRRTVARDYVRPFPGARLLDIGCGPGNFLPLLPGVSYVGFDHNQAYIDEAKQRFGPEFGFHCADVAEFKAFGAGAFDIALSYGVLHHLDDEQALRLFSIAASAVRPGGRLVTADPCFFPGQDPLTRAVGRLDRGMNVRQADAYEALARKQFDDVKPDLIRGFLPFPYAVCVLVCTAPGPEVSAHATHQA